MEDQTQFALIQEIVRRAASLAESGWLEIVLDYKVDEIQSESGNTFLVRVNGIPTEKSLPYWDSLDQSMRALRAHLAQGNRAPFTTCKIHVLQSGKYDAIYGYEPVDWSPNESPDWNFPSAPKW